MRLKESYWIGYIVIVILRFGHLVVAKDGIFTVEDYFYA